MVPNFHSELQRLNEDPHSEKDDLWRPESPECGQPPQPFNNLVESACGIPQNQGPYLNACTVTVHTC